jgi:hypothetical protein
MSVCATRYTGGVSVVGRRRELAEVGRLLERAAAGTGGVLILVGAPGAGKTAMVEVAAGEARRRGFAVLRASPPQGQPGRLVWAQLLHDAGGPDSSVAGLLADDPGPLDLDAAARHLVSRSPRLIVVDDVDHGGADAAEMLSVVAARCVTAPTGRDRHHHYAAGAGAGAAVGRPERDRQLGRESSRIADDHGR